MQLELDINNILVSIVIPVYNVEKYLRQCIESVVNQTYQNIEIILVDDGSKDSSPNICDEYAKNDKRVTVIHQKNGGLSNARNSGTKVAKGEYIYFLDSDDYIELDMIEYLIGEIKICKADLLFFDSIVFKDKNAVTDFSNNYTRKYIYPMDTGINTITKLVENKEFKTPVQFLFIRKAILIENNLEFYDGILHEDGLFTVQLYLKCERVKYIPYQLYHRRIRDNSIMAQKMTWKNFHGYYIGCKELITLYNNLEKQSIEYKFLSSFLAKKVLSVLEIYYKLNKKDRKKEKSEYKDLILQAEKSDFFSSDKLERVIKHSLKLKVIVLIKKQFVLYIIDTAKTIWLFE